MIFRSSTIMKDVVVEIYRPHICQSMVEGEIIDNAQGQRYQSHKEESRAPQQSCIVFVADIEEQVVKRKSDEQAYDCVLYPEHTRRKKAQEECVLAGKAAYLFRLQAYVKSHGKEWQTELLGTCALLEAPCAIDS